MTRCGVWFVMFGLGMVGGTALGADWPQWRGPHRDGVSAETGLLQQWPKDGPKQIWHMQDIGDGYSTPSVVGDRIYLQSNRGMDNEFVQALGVKDGQPVWTTRLGNVGPNDGPKYPGARATPTVDGDRIYALGSDGDLACLDTATGKMQWHKNLRTDFNGQPGRWAYAESPLVDGDVVVCTPGGSEATLVALKKSDGKPVWKSAIPGGDKAAYSSIIIVEAGGIKQYVQFLEKGVVGVDAKTGKFLWRYGHTAEGSPANIPTPVAHNGMVYSATGRGGGGLVKLTVEDGDIEAKQVYASKGLPTSLGGAVEVDGLLYGTTGQGMVCADFDTGDQKWQARGIGAGAVCYADGRIYVHGENGDVALVAATGDSYQEKGRFSPADQPDRGRSKAWAYPVVAGGRLYIRDMSSLWCYDIGDQKAER